MRWISPFILALFAAACGASEGAPANAAVQPEAASAPAAAAQPLGTGAAEGPKLAFPLACTIGRDCEVQNYLDRDVGPAVLDYRCGGRTYDGHNGVDIRILDMAAQARGVDVLAAAPGTVARLRDGVQDISIRDAGAPSVASMECGNGVVVDHGGGWETQYCHLARGSIRVKQGDQVQASQPIARVGLSGQTEFPHLHITVRRSGVVVDPFAPGPVSPGSCAPQAGMWTPEAAKQMAYKRGAILKAGFAGEAVTMPKLQAGEPAPFTPDAAALTTYMLVIGIEAGDELELVLTGPGGAAIASQRTDPFPRDRAQQFQMVGRKRPPAGWPAGEYRSTLRIWRGGQVVAERNVTTRI